MGKLLNNAGDETPIATTRLAGSGAAAGFDR
jgi:hypothetical protein